MLSCSDESMNAHTSRLMIIFFAVILFTSISVLTIYAATSILAPQKPRGGDEASNGYINSAEESDASKIQIIVNFTNSVTNSTHGANVGDVVYLLNGTGANIKNFTTAITNTIDTTEFNQRSVNFTVTKSLLGGSDGAFELHAQVNNGTAGTISSSPGLKFILDTLIPTFSVSSINNTATTVSFSESLNGTSSTAQWTVNSVNPTTIAPNGFNTNISSIVLTHSPISGCIPISYLVSNNFNDTAGNYLQAGTKNLSIGTPGCSSTSSSGGGSGSSGKASAPTFQPPTILEPESPYSPLSLNGRNFLITPENKIVDYTTDSTINLESLTPVTNIISIGQPVELKFRIYSPLGAKHIAHASLYADLSSGAPGTSDETVISYDKYTGKTTHDESGLYSFADVKLISNGEFTDIVYFVTFARSLDVSDIYLKVWDENRYALYQQIHDFWKVDGFAEPSYLSEVNKIAYDGLTVEIFPPVYPPVIESYDEIKEPPKPTFVNQDSSLHQLVNAVDPEAFAKKTGIEYKDGKIRVLMILEEESRDIVEQIKEFADVESTNQKFVQVVVPVENLDLLYKITVKKIQPTSKPVQNSIVTEGFDFVHTAKARDINLQGNGIKVAILDLAFDAANTEISSSIVDKKSFRHDFDGSLISLKGFGHEYVHGTAVAEIVSDIAPNTDLFLYTFSSEVEFLDAMDYAMKNKVDMITMSAGWINYPTDGSSEMVDKIEQAISQGIPFVVSAGNYAETHWEGNFVDRDSNGWHEFFDADEGLSVYADSYRVSQQMPFVMYLMWDSPTGKTYDFDMTLTDKNGDEVAYSSNIQKNSNDIYFEYIVFTPENSGTYSLGISYDGAKKPDAILEIFSPNDIFEYPVSSGSVSVPTDATGIISVGAVNYADSMLEPFSSQGPTNNCKQVPNVMGPDAVTTLAYDQNPFYGTSAASPHVAGLVALILEKIPNATPLEILSLLTENADKKTNSLEYSDNVYGFGIANIEFLTRTLNSKPFIEPYSADCVPSTLQSGDRQGLLTQQSFENQIRIPDWVKKNAKWWSEKNIDDNTFANGLQFLIREEIIVVPIENESVQTNVTIPEWVRTTAKWWSDDQINDSSFAQMIQYLIKNGILKV